MSAEDDYENHHHETVRKVALELAVAARKDGELPEDTVKRAEAFRVFLLGENDGDDDLPF